MSLFSFLDRDHSIARPGYSRWLVPPAALAIHLAIGQVYAFSVFVNPLLAYGPNWSHKEVGYIFSLAIAILGISAALFGRWLETAGPRKAMFVAATCFGLGFLVAALGVHLHSLALIYVGYGGIGGVGLGLGYISPVSTREPPGIFCRRNMAGIPAALSAPGELAINYSGDALLVTSIEFSHWHCKR
jgi:MFS family permease